MERWFEVEHLDVERLLKDWRWLCSGPKHLVARSAFGDLFLADESGCVWWLDVAVGELTKIASSEEEFRSLLKSPDNRNNWFGETEELEFAAKGLVPSEIQCIGFYPPLVCEEGPRKSYLIDLYDNVSFLGDFNEQIRDLPDGEKVKLIVGEKPAGN